MAGTVEEETRRERFLSVREVGRVRDWLLMQRLPRLADNTIDA